MPCKRDPEWWEALMAPRKQASGNSSDSSSSMGRGKRSALMDKDSEEYRMHRARNNLAVKKSRTKSKQRAQETQQKVAQLRAENEALVAKIKILNKELSFLKDLFLAHAGATGGNRGNNCTGLEGVDLSFLNEDEASESKGIASKNVGS
ncbi:CCAAT/enhancer-binding protein gamma-like [Amblyomma americanum]